MTAMRSPEAAGVLGDSTDAGAAVTGPGPPAGTFGDPFSRSCERPMIAPVTAVTSAAIPVRTPGSVVQKLWRRGSSVIVPPGGTASAGSIADDLLESRPGPSSHARSPGPARVPPVPLEQRLEPLHGLAPGADLLQPLPVLEREVLVHRRDELAQGAGLAGRDRGADAVEQGVQLVEVVRG